MFGDNANVGAGDTSPYIKNRVYPGNPSPKMYLENISWDSLVSIDVPGF